MEIEEVPGRLAALGVDLDVTALPRLLLLHDAVLAANARANLTRIVDLADFVEKHLLDSLAGLAAGPPGDPADALFIDVGTGAGFPGLPIAIARPRARVLLVESVAKKARLVEEIAQALGLENVVVSTARAEELGRDLARRERAGRALVRAVGPVAECLEYALPLVRVSGAAVLWRSATQADDELASATRASAVLGGGPPRAIDYALPTAGARRLLVVPKLAPTPDAYPRRTGVPGKRPLA